MTKMRAVQVTRPGGPLELAEREIPDPGTGSVRIRVEACGVCHSDAFTKEGHWPGIQYPRVPGHEVAGVIDALGPGVGGWRTGQRAGVGWHGGHCGVCKSCRRGDFVTCRVAQVPGIAYDGGYSDYMIAPVGALARIPDELSAIEAGPLLCAGVTTYNSLRNSGARPGDLVAVLGLGGLGHLGIQFAAKMGFEPVAIARGKDEEPLARQLGARHYIDGQAQDAATELVRLGGASVILATAPSGKAMSALVNGLAVNGKLVVVGGARRPAGGAGSVADRGASLDRGLAVRHVDRLRGHDGLQRPRGSGVDERTVAAGARRRGVRAHDEWPGTVSRGSHDQPLGREMSTDVRPFATSSPIGCTASGAVPGPPRSKAAMGWLKEIPKTGRLDR
jgi:D-arabinose 1-dehydrogenase-like Zn-dependent alcohol dehydrogenase